MEIISRFGVDDMYPTWSHEEYKRKVNGIFGTSDDTGIGGLHIPFKEVKKVSEPYLNRYCDEARDRDIHFLFEIDNWNGRTIKEMSSSHIINSALMLLKRAKEFKLNYELFVIDNTDNKLLIPKDNIDELAKLDAITWIKTTPVFIAFTKELATRKLLSYFEVVLDRLDTEKVND